MYFLLRKISVIALLVAMLVVPIVKAEAPVISGNPVNIYLFYSDTCPHCRDERAFLDRILPAYPLVTLNGFNVRDTRTQIYLVKIAGALGVQSQYVPVTLIGNDVIYGYQDDETSGVEIEKLIIKYSENGDPDPVGKVLGLTENKPTPTAAAAGPALPADTSQQPKDALNVSNKTISVPILGKVDVASMSLPVLTVVIALLDGFNPCAMWTLLFLISFLLGMKDRKRMWLLGGAFIFTSGAVYFLFLAAWLNLFLFLGLVPWIRIAVGILAVGAGVYYLRDFITNPSGGCKVTGDEKRQAVFTRIRNLAGRRELFLALGGVIILAVAVNMIELVCSAGLPAIYTNVLSLSDLPVWQYYLYLVVYVLIFMFDDLFVFVAAMRTLELTGLSGKYSRWSHLAGGFLMLAIGLLMIFKPELLTFGS